MTDRDSVTPPQSPLEIAQHRLRNKIGIILGTIEIMRLSVADSPSAALEPDTLEDLDRMQRAAQDALTIVDDLPG